MIWFFYLIVVLVFWLLAIVQSSFLAHFTIYGAIPNLVFIFYFLLLFFFKKGSIYHVIFYAVVAGLFLDFLSYTYIGISVVLLLLLGFLIHQIQSSLQEKENDRFPLLYFIALFVISLLLYHEVLNLYLGGFNLKLFISGFNGVWLCWLGYNLVIAITGFFICKTLCKFTVDDKQLKLWK